MVNGVITAKLEHLERSLRRLRSLRPLSLEKLQSEWLVWSAVERELQVAVEVILDVCRRLASLKGQAPPSQGRDAVLLCGQLGILAEPQIYTPLVGFRNIVVRDYDEVRPEIMVEVVNHQLDVLERFRDEVLAYCLAN